eukprot:6420117-Amphidinium_carterae.1
MDCIGRWSEPRQGIHSSTCSLSTTADAVAVQASPASYTCCKSHAIARQSVASIGFGPRYKTALRATAITVPSDSWLSCCPPRLRQRDTNAGCL